MEKSSTIEQPFLEVIKRRTNSRAYSDKPVEPEKIKALFEAARWAPSSNNEQYRFIFMLLKNSPSCGQNC